jgi:hypothetical protein
MEKKFKSTLLFIALITAIILIVYLVLAATTLNTPITNGNYSGTLTFNCTTALPDPLNASLLYNASGGAVGTILATNDTAGNLTEFTLSADISGLTDGTTYNMTCKVENSTASESSTAASSITIDNTPPNVSSFYNTTDGGNYSRNITLNVSVSDATIGVGSVYFNITNTTQIAFLQGSASGVYYSYTLNSSNGTFGDGKYNVTVYANDTQLNNLNSSEKIQITIDNTDPTLSFSCSPTSVEEGGSVTCSCSGSDPTSGVNTTTYTSTPSTTQTGTFTLTCTVTDYTGNSAQGITTYTVTGSPNSGGGGSSTTTSKFWTRTYSVTEEQFSEGYTKIFSKKSRVKVSISGENHYVGITDLTGASVTINVSSEPQQATLTIGQEEKFEVTGDNYYDISVKLNAITDNKADLTIKSIHELMPEEVQEVSPEEPEGAGEEAPVEAEKKAYLWIAIAVILVIAVLAYVIYRKKTGKTY